MDLLQCLSIAAKTHCFWQIILKSGQFPAYITTLRIPERLTLLNLHPPLSVAGWPLPAFNADPTEVP